MARFRKRSAVVEAFRWFDDAASGEATGGGIVERPKGSLPPDHRCRTCGMEARRHGWIQSRGWDYLVCPGAWVVTTGNGKRFPMGHDEFTREYEPVDEPPG